MDPNHSTAQLMKFTLPGPTKPQSATTPAKRNALELKLRTTPIGTSYVDWDNNLSKLASLIESHRLVSLSGPGGAGKTRLSTEYATNYSGANSSKIYYIDLGAHPSAHPIYATIARIFGGRANSLSECAGAIQKALESKPAIFIFDHCDHILTEASQIAEFLVEPNNDFSSVIISRLGSLAESFGHLEITPMDLPVDHLSLPPDELRTHSAVALFAQRADPPIALRDLQEESVRIIASIVDHLGGLPLGIELAAAYTSILEIQELHDALLSDSIRLINLDRLAAPHHASLWRMLDWGYQVLSPTAQSLLCFASLFPDGFKPDIAMKIAGSLRDGLSIRFDASIKTTLDTLVKQQLMRSCDCECGTRIRLDPIVRDFSRSTELFALSGRLLEESFIQHYTYYLEEISTHLFDHDNTGPPCIEIHELANINEAMRLILCLQNSECALRLTLTLWRYWYSRGHHTHERIWVTKCIEFTSRHENLLGFSRMNSIAGVLHYGESLYSAALSLFGRAVDGLRDSHALVDLAECLQRQALAACAMGDLSLATRACSEAVSIRRSLEDATGLADSLSILGSLLHAAGHSAQAIRVHKTCLALLYKQEAPDYKKLSSCLGMGASSLRLGLLEAASQSLLRAQSIAEAIGSKTHLASIYDSLGQLARRRNEYYLAREHFGRSLALSSSTGEHYSSSVTYCNLGEACLEFGAHNEARLFLNRSLELAKQNHHNQLVSYALSALCELAFHESRHRASRQTLLQLETREANETRPHLRAVTYRAHGLIALLADDQQRGLQLLFSSLKLCREIHDPFEFSQTLRYTSMALAQAGDLELASASLDLRNSIIDFVQGFSSLSGLPPLVHGDALDTTDTTLFIAAVPLTKWSGQMDEFLDALAQRCMSR
jgi:predicted ATPase/tetratricopeptide (TPR) repeat protein